MSKYTPAQVQAALREDCDAIRDMLLEKNKSYGNSALDPVRIFCREVPTETMIMVRLDDKLSRLSRGSNAGEDVIKDIIGYLHLLRVLRMLEGRDMSTGKPLTEAIVKALAAPSVRREKAKQKRRAVRKP